MPFYKKDIFLNSIFYLLLVLILVNRVVLFLNVNINCIDSDLPFFWAGIKDYSEGLFYEPRFYGQDYNTFMESLLSVPLYWLGVPVYYALPIATHFVSLFPFLFTAFYLFYKGRKENGILILCLLMCMCAGYDFMVSLPRGVSGVFFTSFFILSLLNPTHFGFLVLNTLLSVLGYFVTPNSVVVSVPLMTFLFLHNYKNKKYYFVTLLCLLFAGPCYLLFDKFYKDHPDYIIYGLSNNWSFTYFFDTLKHLDKSFAHVTFLTDENSAMLLGLLLLMTLFLFIINRSAFVAFLSFFGIILLSFCTSKVHEGVVWPFYSFSRMYIGIPVVIVLFSVFFWFRSGPFLNFFILLALTFSVYKFYTFKSNYVYHTDEKRWNGVHLIPLKTVVDGCSAFKDICKTNGTEHLLISNTFWLSTYMNYGGQAIFKDFPDSEETSAERRYWVRNGNKDKVLRKFIFLSVDFNFDKLPCVQDAAFSITRLDDYGIFLIENNNLKNGDFISLVNSCERN